MKTCKKGHDYEEAQKRCPVCLRAGRAAWAAANPDKVKAKNAAWRAANAEKERSRKAAWRAANPEREKDRNAAYRAANPQKERDRAVVWSAANRDKRCAYAAKAVANLRDDYVARVIGLPVREVPPELINLKREQIRLHRLARELEQALNQKEPADERY